MENPASQFAAELIAEISKINLQVVSSACELVNSVHSQGGQIFLIGNGGSAGIASHVAVDLTKAWGRPAVTFHDPSLLTCYTNDYGYDKGHATMVDEFVKTMDLCIFISSSGNSPNIVNAAKCAQEKGTKVISLSGFDEANSLNNIGDIRFWVNSHNYNVVETVHQIWLLSVVEQLRVELLTSGK